MHKILVVAQEKEIAVIEEALSQYLKQGGELLISKTAEGGWKALMKEHPELALIDSAFVESEEAWLSPPTETVFLVDKKAHSFKEVLEKPLRLQAILALCEKKGLLKPTLENDVLPM